MLDPTGLAIAAVGVALSQLVKAITGFGSALVLMPALLMVLEPAEALLILVATDIVSGAWLMRDVWSRIHWGLVLALFAGIVPGQMIGTELLDVLDVAWVKRILGVVVLVMGVQFAIWPTAKGSGELEGLPEAPARLLALGTLSGLAGGVMAGLVGAAGPPVIAYCKRFFDGQFYRAQLITLFQISAVTLGFQLWLRGADPGVLQNMLWLVVPLIVGNRTGAFLAPRVSREVFGRATGVVLAAAGVALFF